MGSTTAKTIPEYNQLQSDSERGICETLMKLINSNLKEAESKLWHGGPVWFLAGNPIVGYSKIKSGIKLMFWSGADFAEDELMPGSGKFKDASVTYTELGQIKENSIKRWLEKAQTIQWDYKNIVKRQGKLTRL